MQVEPHETQSASSEAPIVLLLEWIATIAIPEAVPVPSHFKHHPPRLGLRLSRLGVPFAAF